MNDQIKPAPLQGKVILEPAQAAQERPPAPAQRLEEESFERLEELDEFTEVAQALTVRPRRRHRRPRLTPRPVARINAPGLSRGSTPPACRADQLPLRG